MKDGKNTALPDRVSLRSRPGFAAFVRGARIQSGMTQEELAREVGKSRRWLQDVEGGKAAPSLPSAIALAVALGYEFAAERSERSPVLDQVFGELA